MSQDESDFDDTFLYQLARERRTSEIVGYMKRAEKPVIRARAAEILGDFADVPRPYDQEEITRELINVVLDEENDEVRARAIDSLYRHGKAELERLITFFADYDASETPDWVNTQTLIDWLDSDMPEFRMVAAAALGEIGDEHAISHIIPAFDDIDPRVRERAVRACGTIGDERATRPIIDRLQDNDVRVKRAAANALADIGTDRALEALIPLTRADDSQLRHIAATELHRLESTKPVVVLVRAVEDDAEMVQRAAIHSLLELMASDAGEEGLIRSVVAEQFTRIDSDIVVPLLVDLLEQDVRIAIERHVVWLLGRIVEPDEENAETVFDILLSELAKDHMADLARDSLVQLESDRLEKYLRIYTQTGRGPDSALERAKELLDEISTEHVDEDVVESVEYTFVQEPSDYTKKRRGDGP